MDITENSLASALFGADARDYYQRQGFSAGVQKFLNQRLRVGAEFRRDKYLDSRRETGWSMFGPKQPFREVPAIREGAVSSVVVNFLADYITFRSWSEPEFGIETQGEFGFGNYTFAQYVADARLKTTVLPGRIWLAVRGRVGSATGDAPPQKLFTIGGIGTLPGYPQNEYGGNRMLLLQTDLLIAPLESSNLRLIISNDFGGVSSTSTTSGILGGFPGDIGAFKYSPGIYLGTPTGWIRIGAAWRTDVSSPPRFVMRLAKPF
jgi:hypothetical protein